MTFGSTSKNIGLLTIFLFIGSIVGLFFADYTLKNIAIALISFYTLNILGVWMTLHRYYSHKSFELNTVFKWFFSAIAFLAGRGSILGWVYLHRLHHAYSDQEQDPHSPHNLGYKMFGFGHMKKQEGEMKIFLVKELMTPVHLFVHKWYMLMLMPLVAIFAIIDLQLLYWAWILPATMIQFSTSNFNYFGHTHGYRNYETREQSRNNPWLWLIILGEAWHNNHHADAKNYSTMHRWWELDPLAWLIKLLERKKKLTTNTK
jgi:stearoyl-CoA desaturase (delta-9 desaturase)